MSGRDGSDPDRRKRYRSLFLTYPAAWRAAHEDVVLDTLLDLHDDRRIPGPGRSDRIRFAIDGLRVRFALPRKSRPSRRFASPASLAPIASFDQTNGIVEDARELSEWEQLHVNAAAGANSDEQRTAPRAWFTLHAASRSDRRARADRRSDRARHRPAR